MTVTTTNKLQMKKQTIGAKANILVVEDELTVSSMLKYTLEREGMQVYTKHDGEGVLDFIRAKMIDAVILDLMLPKTPGIEVCNQIRQCEETANIPIVVISAKGEERDLIAALEFGADDYIVKPFSPAVLVARVKAVFRRIRPAFSGKKLKFVDVEMDLSTYKVTRNGHEVKLAPIEFQILQILMEQPGIVLSREALIYKIWDDNVHVGARTVDVHITRLRKALLKYSATGEDVIKTVRLAGYAIRSVTSGNTTKSENETEHYDYDITWENTPE